MLVNGQNKAADLSSLLMVHSVATAFKSLLRPSDLISHDKGPAESLGAVITNDAITDVDKILLHLDPKEFTVEPSTLQSLQQLIQWVADLALNLLARLPEQRMQIKSGGVNTFFNVTTNSYHSTLWVNFFFLYWLLFRYLFAVRTSQRSQSPQHDTRTPRHYQNMGSFEAFLPTGVSPKRRQSWRSGPTLSLVVETCPT